jgi:hypothetical protein
VLGGAPSGMRLQPRRGGSLAAPRGSGLSRLRATHHSLNDDGSSLAVLLLLQTTRTPPLLLSLPPFSTPAPFLLSSPLRLLLFEGLRRKGLERAALPRLSGPNPPRRAASRGLQDNRSLTLCLEVALDLGSTNVRLQTPRRPVATPL